MLSRKKSDRPLYRQISDRLRSVVASMATGERIPSEPELAREFHVSRFTIARSVQELVDDGLISRRQGSGSFVASPPLKRTPGELLSFTEAVRGSGHVVTNRLLAFGPTQWRSGLPFSKTEALVAFERLRFVDGAPAAIHRSILPERTADAIGLDQSRAAAPDVSLYSLFEAARLSVERGIERLMARLPTDEERRLLELSEDGVVVEVQRVSFAADGRPLDAVEAIYDARRYGYEAQIVRKRVSVSKSSSSKSGETSHVHEEHEPHFGGVTALGPRLGPWTRKRRRRG
jgi:GntR family transcriptional regulator